MEKENYQNITINGICEKAEVSVGSPYHYFLSKNDFLIEMYSRTDQYFLVEAAHHFRRMEDPLRKIVEYFVIYAKYNEMN
jgi:TetR/AcrR family fatty acid metabolism transcriptional regulator